MKAFRIVLLVAVLMWVYPHAALAQDVSYKPFVFEIKNSPLTIGLFDREVVSEEDVTKQIPQANTADPRVEILKSYLAGKNSPMTDYAESLLDQYHYKYIIGISFAESNFCKRNIRPHNCWGIGGGKPEAYESYPAAFARANRLIQKYHDSGLTNAKLMRNRWVGWQNDKWIIAVNQAIKQMEALGL